MKRPWTDFAAVRSESFVADLMYEAEDVPHDALVSMAAYRKAERMAACSGRDPIRILLAYAQDELAYDEQGAVISIIDRGAYKKLPREQRLNKFGLAYRREAQFYLNKTLADIVIGAAIHLCKTQRWTTVLYDGLRTVEGAFNLYNFATSRDIDSGLLALPGESAHNKGMAVDSMMEDFHGREIDMGGHFDHLDMETNSRLYTGDGISPAAKKNRLIREAAFLRSAFSQGLVIAPLRNEFWDDRLPENREDLWRVLDSAARCMGMTLLTPEDEAMRKKNRAEFRKKWENWSYANFLRRWRETFKGRDSQLKEMFGVQSPPLAEKPEFYHGNYHPIYDRDLKTCGKNLTEA